MFETAGCLEAYGRYRINPFDQREIEHAFIHDQADTLGASRFGVLRRTGARHGTGGRFRHTLAPCVLRRQVEGQEERQEVVAGRPRFPQGISLAYATIYERNDYAAAIPQLEALGQDDRADVANLIGYSYRKLGNYQLASVWYERALKSDPNHVRTWQYYGLWQVEQGNREQAKYHLSKIEASPAATAPNISRWLRRSRAAGPPTDTPLSGPCRLAGVDRPFLVN